MVQPCVICGREYKCFPSTAKRRRHCSIECREDLARRFWQRVKKSDKCWEWQGTKSRGGYGYLFRDYKKYQATHILWYLTYGIWPGKPPFVLHHCDNRLCVRPDHLWLGTTRDNILDAVRKGRHCHWETHGGA